jgi:hypothetical protein
MVSWSRGIRVWNEIWLGHRRVQGIRGTRRVGNKRSGILEGRGWGILGRGSGASEWMDVLWGEGGTSLGRGM